MGFATLYVVVAILVVSGVASKKQGCGVTKNETYTSNFRIVNGVEANQGAWPWIASLSKHGMAKCGGAIINNEWIVTAAHCFDVNPDPFSFEIWEQEMLHPSAYTVTIGEHERYSNLDNAEPVEHGVALVVLHPEYDPDDSRVLQDIALIKLATPIQMTDRVQPICLPDKGQVFDAREGQCYAAGWGDTQGTAEKMFVLQEIHSEIVNPVVCNIIYSKRGGIVDTQLCFGDGRRGTCVGDSGGPMMCKKDGDWTLVGVTSFGVEKCGSVPGVFTKVAQYIDWIDETMDKYPDEIPNPNAYDLYGNYGISMNEITW